eukprot:1144213-Pelagomonas_calceolata.AAC.4
MQRKCPVNVSSSPCGACCPTDLCACTHMRAKGVFHECAYDPAKCFGLCHQDRLNETAVAQANLIAQPDA